MPPEPGSMMTGQEGKMEHKAGAAVVGRQGSSENNDAKNVGAPEVAACAPKAAAAMPMPPRHRRSKSASSERNGQTCKHGPSRGAVEQEQCCAQAQLAMITPCSSKNQNPPDARKSFAIPPATCSIHLGPRDQRPNASPNHSVSLENDLRT